MCQTYILYTFKRERSNQMIRIFHFTHCSRNVWFNWLFFVWALIAGGFLQMDNPEMITKERQMATLLMRTWRLSFAVVMMEFLEWHVYWSWGVKFSWNLPNFSWFGMGLPWLFFTKERETLLMRSWFWWTVCLRSGCFILNQVNPENPFLQAFALMHWKFMISLPWKACWDLFLFRMPWPRKPLRMVDLGLSSCFDMHRENRISGTTAPCTMIGLVILFVEDQSHPPACLRSRQWYSNDHESLLELSSSSSSSSCSSSLSSSPLQGKNNNKSPIDPARQFLILALHKGLWVLFICPNMGESSGGFDLIWDDYREAATVWCDWIYLTKQETKNELFIEYII